MAALSFSTWVPIDLDTNVEGREIQRSVIVDLARPRTMTTNQVDVPRYADADVGGGATLTQDDSASDTVPMFAYQYNGRATFDQAEHEDTLPDDIGAWSYEWLNSVNMKYDNASLGVSADRSATVSNFQPYRSLYKALRTNDNSGAISYTADANYLSGALSGSAGFSLISQTLGKVEGQPFWNEASGAWILHPSLKEKIRGIVNPVSGQNIFVESTSGMPGGGYRTNYNLLGIPAYFSFGAIVSSNFQMTVTGNKLMAIVNRNHIVHGKRVEPQTRFIPAEQNISALEHNTQARMRKGFRLTIPNSAAVLEVTG